MKSKAGTVVGRGEKSLLSDPTGSEILLGRGKEERAKCGGYRRDEQKKPRLNRKIN